MPPAPPLEPVPTEDPPPQRIEVHISLFTIVKVFAAVLCAYAVYVLWPLLLLVFLALFLAVTLHAFVGWLDSKGIKHWLSLLLVIGGLITVLGVGIALLVPALINQAASFSHEFPRLREEVLNQIPAGWGVRNSLEHLLDTANWSAADPWISHFMSAGGTALNGLSEIALVLVIGHASHGARRWLFHFQPSEPAKLGLVLALAHYCAWQSKKMGRFLEGFLVPSAMLGCVLALIFLEPDWGTTILLATVGVAIMYMAGTRLLYLVPAMILGGAAISFLLMHNPVRLTRLLAFLHPDTYKDGVGYQSWQAILALGAGGWDGLGLGNGRQKLGFVPENQTDFILSVIGEELGVVATLLVIVLFAVLVTCGFVIAHRSKPTFNYLFGAGISMLIGLQAFINIAVVTSMVPNKGLPLPFISYGGSNLVTMLAAIGLLLGLARRGSDAESTEEDSLESEFASSDPAASLPF